MKSRIIAMVLCIVMLLTMLPIGSMATVDTTAYIEPTIVVDSTSAAPGSEVEVDLLVANNPGMAGARITVSYDEKLTLMDAVSGEAFAALDYTKPGAYSSPCNFNWDSENAEVTEDGILLTLKFQVTKTCTEPIRSAAGMWRGKPVCNGISPKHLSKYTIPG